MLFNSLKSWKPSLIVLSLSSTQPGIVRSFTRPLPLFGAAAFTANYRTAASSFSSPKSSSCAATSAPSTLSMTSTSSANTAASLDPYIWLEEVESEESLTFAKSANEDCLARLGNPETAKSNTYSRILRVLESNDRIPHVAQYGVDEDGQPILYNFWKDAEHPKGLWRKTTLNSYKSDSPTWTMVLDVDALAEKDEISWVYKGSRALPRSRDSANTAQVTRCLLSLSRGGSDAVHIKEFDLIDRDFVTEMPFNLPEAKTRASYKSRDVLLVGSDFGPDSLTDSGYPRTVREWVRGTDIKDAPVIFEGDKKDVSVSVYISDERLWNGGIYEVRSRSLTFYTSKYWARKIQPEHLLAPNDPEREGASDPPEFVEVQVQEDANIGFQGNLMEISLRSDWEPVPGGKTYKSGSILFTDADTFLDKGPAESVYMVLFEPTERTAYEYSTVTKNYLILSTMDTVKSKLTFFKIGEDGSTLTPVEGTSEAQIRNCSVRPLDPYTGSDEFWFTSSDYITPSTLFLADAAKVETPGAEQDSFITEKIKSLPPQFDTENLDVSQQFATSKDGTEIPYFIIKSKGTVFDGSNPTLLYGYGGFEVSLGPHYVATAGLSWLERGGVYVEANIRGGGEFGPSWHQAGLKANRNKCYEDFIAVGEHLIETKICTPKTLAARGGSNGGLLMGNMFTMRPDLFGAIHCAVPLLDMQRFHTLLAGASWMAEYGDPSTDDWKFMEQYSPYHNLKKDVEYPPILVTTSTRDDRVHPAHARKFVKKLWDMGKQDTVYYYENIEGGHGGAADAKQSAFLLALAYDFMWEKLTKK